MDSLAKGVVVLGIPDELAWTIYIDGQDSDSIGQLISFRSTLKYRSAINYSTEGYDFSALCRFISLFPSRPLANLLKGYFAYIGVPLPREDEDESGRESPPIQQEEDSFDIVLVRILLAYASFCSYSMIRMPLPP